MIQVKTFYAHNDLRNYSYIIVDDQTAKAWVIDPYEAGPMRDFIREHDLKLQGILNTHHHFDHIRGNAPLQEAFGAPVKTLRDQEEFLLDKESSLETLDTPGHTMDHQVFVWKHEGKPVALFSGDTLFNAGVGNCKNGGKVEVLFETTRRLIKELPPSTRLYPGHDYIQKNLEFAHSVDPGNTAVDQLLSVVRGQDVEQRKVMTLGEELGYNPFFRIDELREEAQLKTFKHLRSLRDNW